MAPKSKKTASTRVVESPLSSIGKAGGPIVEATPAGEVQTPAGDAPPPAVDVSRSKVDRDERYKRMVEYGEELKGTDRCWWCTKHDEVCKVVGEVFRAKFPDDAKQLSSPSCHTCVKRGKTCARTIEAKMVEDDKAKMGGKKRKVDEVVSIEYRTSDAQKAIVSKLIEYVAEFRPEATTASKLERMAMEAIDKDVKLAKELFDLE